MTDATEKSETIGLHNLECPAGHRQKRQRIGRGIGSGRGKTSGRGMKGQLARRTKMRAGFEGGQLPIQRRVPKRGFINIHRVETHGVNIGALERFDAGTEITLELLRSEGLVPKKATVVKLLGHGELSKSLRIAVHRASKGALEKVERAGGSVELVGADDASVSSAEA